LAFIEMIAEYLEHAMQFEKLAAAESDPEVKAKLAGQARAYRKLADERAGRLNLPSPPSPTGTK
jgi:hypothetical protein